MVVWWLCWHRTILIRNIPQKQYSQFPPVHDFRKPWWGVAYVPCMTNLLAFYAWLIRWHVTCMLSLAGHWQGWRALSNHVCAHSVISMWHVVCLQHLARASSEQSRSTTVLLINHVIQMPQCLSGFVNHDYVWVMSMSSSGRSVKNKCTEIIFNVVLFIICANLQYPKLFPLELCFYQFCNKPQCNSFNFYLY